MSDVSRWVEILRNNQKKMLEMEKTNRNEECFL